MAAVGTKTNQVLLQRFGVVLKFGNAAAGKFLCQHIECAAHRINVSRAVTPVHAQLSHAQRIHPVAERDAAFGLRCLLAVHLQAKAIGAIAQNDGRKFSLCQ